MIKINDTKHARLDVVLYDEALLAHVQAPVALDNGSIGVLGDYVAGEREVKALEKATATSTKDELVLVSAPELIYETYRPAQNQLKNFYNEAGVATRAYHLSKVKRFKISKEGLDMTAITDDIDLASKDYFVVPTAGYTMALTESATGAIGKLIRLETEGVASYIDTSGNFTANVYPMYVIDVL